MTSMKQREASNAKKTTIKQIQKQQIVVRKRKQRQQVQTTRTVIPKVDLETAVIIVVMKGRKKRTTKPRGDDSNKIAAGSTKHHRINNQTEELKETNKRLNRGGEKHQEGKVKRQTTNDQEGSLPTSKKKVPYRQATMLFLLMPYPTIKQIN